MTNKTNVCQEGISTITNGGFTSFFVTNESGKVSLQTIPIVTEYYDTADLAIAAWNEAIDLAKESQ